jgi:primosomal protein N' (replication factor Y)
MAGRVIIQTFCPEHYAIKAASKHDYQAFYAREIEYRRQFDYPPFTRLVRLVFSHTNTVGCRQEAERLSQLITTEKDRRGLSDLRLIGPAPAFISRLRGRYQWQIILCGIAPTDILRDITIPRGWTVDIDPVGVV